MRNIFLLCVLALLVGCISFTSRDNQRGHPYTGVNSDLYMIRCAWVGETKDEKIPMYQRVPLATIVTTFCLIDMPFSFVADTLFLPIDLMSKPTDFHLTPTSECKPLDHEM